jgi:hypothetical protein
MEDTLNLTETMVVEVTSYLGDYDYHWRAI